MTGGPSVSAERSSADSGDRDGHTIRSEGDEAVAEGDHQLPKDVIFGLLSAQRRRRVLAYLAENEAETTLSDLADHIAALENDVEIRLLDSQQRKRVYVALYQCHLPKMDDADVIDFNQSRGAVVRRPEADQLYAYLAVGPQSAPDDESTQTDETATVRRKITNIFP